MDPSLSSATGPITRYDTDRSARTANSLLSIKYPGEQVTFIPPQPEWDGITLGNLKSIGSSDMARLANDLGLTTSEGSPDPEMARVNNLNAILSHLGVSCARPHPSALKPELTNGEPGSRSNTGLFPRGTGHSSPHFRGRRMLSEPS